MSFVHPDQLHDTFTTAFAAGDVDELLDLYEPGALQLGRGSRTASGRDELRTVFEHLVAAGVTLGGRQVMSLVAGDLALTSSEYEVPTTDDAPATVRSVRTVELSRRQPDGTWRVAIDVPAFS